MPRSRKARIRIRIAFLVAATVVLAIVCRQGSPLLLVGVAFTVYVGAATLWVRGQYQASVDAIRANDPKLKPWTPCYWISIPGAVGSGALFVLGARADNSTLLLAGALLSYFGLGYVIMRFRTKGGEVAQLAVGGGFLVVSAGLTGMGLLWLERGSWMVVLAVGILIAPIGPSILSDPAIRWLQERGRGCYVALAFVVGVLALVADTWIAAERVETWWLAAVAFGALALLTIAIVSSTQADIAAVIGAVTLMGVTSESAKKPPDLTPKPADSRVLVALGDSYMSGEGADVYYSEQVDLRRKTHDNHCNRAPTAWAAMAGRTPATAARPERDFDSVAFLACSGARTFHVRHLRSPIPKVPQHRRTQYNEPGPQLDQVETLKKGLGGDAFDPSLVVVSLGGNDVGFSTIGATCLAPGDCIEQRDLWEDNLDSVRSALEATYDEIREEFPHSPILVVPYPAPIYTNEAGQPVRCKQVALSAKDLQFIVEFVPKLNKKIHEAADAKRFHYLAEMERALARARLQLCDPDNNGRPGLNFIGLRSVGGIAEERFNPKNWYHNSLHPNERGHAAMLRTFEAWRAENRNLADEAPKHSDNPAPTGESPAAPYPQCDLVEDEQSTTTSCDDAAMIWVKGEVRDALLPPGWWILQIAAAAAAAWLLGVAIYGWWKPWWQPWPPAGNPRV